MIEDGLTLSSNSRSSTDAYRLHVVVSDVASQSAGSLIIPIRISRRGVSAPLRPLHLPVELQPELAMRGPRTVVAFSKDAPERQLMLPAVFELSA